MFKSFLNRPKTFFTWLLLTLTMLANAEVGSELPPNNWHTEVTTLTHRLITYNNISKAGLFLIVLPNVNSYRSNGNLGQQATVLTGYSGLVMGGIAVSGGAQLNTVYTLNSINDALNIGLNPAYDVTNTTLVYYHIAEFFRMAPAGKLFIYLVSQSTTLTSICTPTTGAAWALLTSTAAAGQIRYCGVCLNPASGYTPTVANGINSDTIAVSSGTYSGAAVQAQSTANIMYGKHMPVRFFVEARNIAATSGVSGLIDATGSAANNVQLVALNDHNVATANALYANHAAVGTVLGLRANLSVQQSLAYVAVGNLQNSAFRVAISGAYAFVSPGLSSGTALNTYTTGYTVDGAHTTGNDDTILSNGFLAPTVKPMYTGVYINNDVTATATTDDYYNGPYGLVVAEAARLMYITMIPNLNEDVNIDPTTGFLDINLIKNWEAQLNLAGTQNLSNYFSIGADSKPAIKYLIDPNQNVLSNDTIDIQIVGVPKGFASQINEYIGLANPYQQAA